MPHHYNKLLFALLILLPMWAWALPSDREQSIEIEADHAQLDDERGITQYKGRAILTQGSLRIEGDIITFYYDENKELSKAIAEGHLATYKQIHKPNEEPVRARALRMEYHAKKQKIYLIGQGYVWQTGKEFSGNYIEYNIARNIVTANAGPVKIGDKTLQAKDRVHFIIPPPNRKKKVSTEPKPAQKNDTTYPTVTTRTRLNVRTGPGTQYDSLGIFNVGGELIILTEQKDWLQVRGVISGKVIIGWISRRYVQLN